MQTEKYIATSIEWLVYGIRKLSHGQGDQHPAFYLLSSTL